MAEYLVEFNRDDRWQCRKYKGLSYKQLEMLMVELHGREWRDAL